MMSVEITKTLLDGEIHRLTWLRDNVTENGRELEPHHKTKIAQLAVTHMRDILDEMAMDVFMRRPTDFDPDYMNDLLAIVHQMGDKL